MYCSAFVSCSFSGITHMETSSLPMPPTRVSVIASLLHGSYYLPRAGTQPVWKSRNRFLPVWIAEKWTDEGNLPVSLANLPAELVGRFPEKQRAWVARWAPACHHSITPGPGASCRASVCLTLFPVRWPLICAPGIMRHWGR